MNTTPSLANLSLAFRDEIGGSHVNLMNSKTPADIYKVIADKTIEKLQRFTAAQKRTTSENGQEETTESDLAQWWLDFGITRKVTKRNCMTFPYGSKQRGFSDQILEDHLRPCLKTEQCRNAASEEKRNSCEILHPAPKRNSANSAHPESKRNSFEMIQSIHHT